jgi:hypothetical protein
VTAAIALAWAWSAALAPIGGPPPSAALRTASVPGESAASPETWWTDDDWTWVDKAPVSTPAEPAEKSTRQAIARSALLPGLGQRYAGHPDRAKIYFAAEAVIWTTFAIFRVQGDEGYDRYVEYAQLNGGAPPGEDSDYYEHIGMWNSLEEWHDIVRRDARATYPDDPAAQEQYFQKFKRYDESQYWAWPNEDVQLRYRQLRSDSESDYRDARLAVGAAILNRLVSMADALALTRQYNRNLRSEGVRLELRIAPENTIDGLVVGPVLSAQY